MSSLLWILESVENDKFPYRLSIQKDGKKILCLRVQNRWPGAGSQIFCLKESEDYSDPVEEIERVPIISLNRYGKRLSVVLDRPTNKRCEFLFLKKKYKTKEGEYEQIFWRTQQGLKERKPRVKLTARGDARIHVLIDINEKYPWKFQECVVERKALPAGDYALLRDDGIAAVVERKTLKLANEWTLRFFQAIESHERDALPDRVAEIAEEYGGPSPDFKGGIYYDIREYILDESRNEFISAELKDKFPDAPESTVKRVLQDLKKEGLITSMGRGRKSRWIKV